MITRNHLNLLGLACILTILGCDRPSTGGQPGTRASGSERHRTHVVARMLSREGMNNVTVRSTLSEVAPTTGEAKDTGLIQNVAAPTYWERIESTVEGSLPVWYTSLPHPVSTQEGTAPPDLTIGSQRAEYIKDPAKLSSVSLPAWSFSTSGNQIIVEAEDMTPLFKRAGRNRTPLVVDGYVYMFWNGELRTEIDCANGSLYGITAVVSGEARDGGPQCHLLVDTETVASSILPIRASGTRCMVRGKALISAGQHTLTVRYDNDTGQRNLWVDKIILEPLPFVYCSDALNPERNAAHIRMSYVTSNPRKHVFTVSRDLAWQRLAPSSKTKSGVSYWRTVLPYPPSRSDIEPTDTMQVTWRGSPVRFNPQLPTLFAAAVRGSKSDPNRDLKNMNAPLPAWYVSAASNLCQQAIQPMTTPSEDVTSWQGRRTWTHMFFPFAGPYRVNLSLSGKIGINPPVYELMLDGKVLVERKLDLFQNFEIKRDSLTIEIDKPGWHEISIRHLQENVPEELAGNTPRCRLFLKSVDIVRQTPFALALPKGEVPQQNVSISYTIDLDEPTDVIDSILTSDISGVPDLDTEFQAFVKRIQFGDETRTCMLTLGSAEARWRVGISADSRLRFGYSVHPRVWQLCEDGVTFRVASLEQDGTRRTVFEKYIDPERRYAERTWIDADIPIGNGKAGQTTLIFSTESGFPGMPGDDWQMASEYVCGLWSNVRIVAPAEERKTGDKRPNVVLISWDTVRADRLELYGHYRETAPGLTELAGKGVLLENCSSQAGWTLPSHASVFSSLYPSFHRAIRRTSGLLADSVTTLAECLRDSGYSTEAVTANGFVGRSFNLDQGFQEIDEHEPRQARPDAKLIVDLALERLEDLRDEQPFFLFLHTYEPHDYYRYRPYLRELVEQYDPYYEGNIPEDNFQNLMDEQYGGCTARDLEHVLAIYDAAIRVTDREFSRLFEELDATGLTDDTLIVLFSDHGEGFKDNNLADRVGHVRRVHEDLLHVPVVFSMPGMLPENRRIPALTETIDIAPTILDILDLDIPASFQGVSLLELMQGTGTIDKEYACASEFQGPTLFSIRDDKVKYIYGTSNELYFLNVDPGETHNMNQRFPELCEDYMSTRADIMARISSRAPSIKESVSQLDARTVDRLRGLGYLK